MKKLDRSSNIELLRIITIMGVIVLHYNGNIAFGLVEKGSLNQYFLLILEAVFICAVNLFVLISGYFSVKSCKRRIIKILDLIIQVMVMGLLKYFISSLVLGSGFSISGIISSLIPNNYFVFIYTGLYIISPYINLAIQKLDKTQFKKLLGVNMLIFSIWPCFMDIVWEITGRHFNGMYMSGSFGSGLGYTLIQFVLMYLLGAYLQKFGTPKKLSSTAIILILILSFGILFAWQLVLPQSAREYCNPFVILIAVLVFIVFSKINIKSRAVNHLAKATFSTFLLHDLFLHYIGIERVVNKNILFLALHIFASIIGIYLVCWLIWFVYDLISKPIISFIDKYTSRLDKFISVSFDERR